MKQEIVLFGASSFGEGVYKILSSRYSITCFCDNDEKKWGQFLCGVEIKPPYFLKANREINVVITSVYHEQISEQLFAMGLRNVFKFDATLNLYDAKIHYNIKEIDLGQFFLEENTSYLIEDLAFLAHGSSILDYFFLKALVKKLGIRNYLEIGTFMGESIAAISDLCNHCYSISLPDEMLQKEFNAIFHKENFSRYFSYKKNNITHYQTDSKTFDYSVIKDDIQLVFIDGDHSYEGVISDTKNIFNFINTEDSIVVWHDFKYANGKFRDEVVRAVFDCLEPEFHNQIYVVDRNLCGVYIPEKFKDQFPVSSNPSELISYEVTIKPKRNIRN